MLGVVSSNLITRSIYFLTEVNEASRPLGRMIAFVSRFAARQG